MWRIREILMSFDKPGCLVVGGAVVGGAVVVVAVWMVLWWAGWV